MKSGSIKSASRSRADVITAVGFALLVLVTSGCGGTTGTNPPTDVGNAATNGTSRDGTPVFPLPLDRAAAIRQANLPELPSEITVFHIHAHVDVEINAHVVTIPADVGITRQNPQDPGSAIAGISPLHTHDTSGIAHIEAAKEDVFTVGQLFAEWGVKLDKICVATYCADDNNQLLGFLNGQLVGDPASIPLSNHAEIYIWYGKKGSNPKVAASFAFPPGL